MKKNIKETEVEQPFNEIFFPVSNLIGIEKFSYDKEKFSSKDIESYLKKKFKNVKIVIS
jgi:hypothetical protein